MTSVTKVSVVAVLVCVLFAVYASAVDAEAHPRERHHGQHIAPSHEAHKKQTAGANHKFRGQHTSICIISKDCGVVGKHTGCCQDSPCDAPEDYVSDPNNDCGVKHCCE